jgi:hypothetical protein
MAVKPSESLGIQTVLVAPFRNIPAESGPEAGTRCPLCGVMTRTGPVPDEVPGILTSKLMALLQPLPYTWIPGDDVDAVLSGLHSSKGGMQSDLERYVAIGRQKGVDAVLVGHVFRFTERAGNRYSIQSPASVEFDLHLIRISDARIVWMDHFDETQQALSDNILQAGSFFKRGGTWITAQELAFSGLEEMIGSFPRP